MKNPILNLTLSIFVFASTLTSAAALVFAEERVPVINLEQLHEGASWTWDYLTDGTEIYSSERYTIIEVNGATVTIEMATQLPGEPGYTAHTRLLVPVDRCLKAYANKVDPEPWSFRMFIRNKDKWDETPAVSTLAFEEKFNCNGHIYTKSNEFETVFHDSEFGPVFEHKKWRKLPGSWYRMNGDHAAIAVEKRFEKPQGHFYLMKLKTP